MRVFLLAVSISFFMMSCDRNAQGTENMFIISNQTNHKVVIKPWLFNKDSLIVCPKGRFLYEEAIPRGKAGSNNLLHIYGDRNTELELVFNDSIIIIHRNEGNLENSIMREDSWIETQVHPNSYSYTYTIYEEDFDRAVENN
jgi:hypothetical protein